MVLSEQVFCADMALSRVRQLENVHLIALHEQAVKVSSKCLQEINRLREAYRPDVLISHSIIFQVRRRVKECCTKTKTQAEWQCALKSSQFQETNDRWEEEGG